MVEWGATEELGRVCKAVGAIVGEAIVGGAALAIADTEAGRGGPAGAPGALTGVGGGGPAGFPPTVGGPDIVVVVVEGAAPVDLGTEAELSSLDEQGGLWCLLLVDLALATASAGVLTSAPLRLTMSTRGQASVMAAEGGVQCSSLYKPDIATQSAKMSRAASDGGLRTRRWATVPSEARTPMKPVGKLVLAVLPV